MSNNRKKWEIFFSVIRGKRRHFSGVIRCNKQHYYGKTKKIWMTFHVRATWIKNLLLKSSNSVAADGFLCNFEQWWISCEMSVFREKVGFGSKFLEFTIWGKTKFPKIRIIRVVDFFVAQNSISSPFFAIWKLKNQTFKNLEF